MNPIMKTTNATSRESGRRTWVESAWNRMKEWKAQARGARPHGMPRFGSQCGHHFRLDDFRALPRMAAGMDPASARTKLFKLAHGVFLSRYFQYFLKIQKHTP